VRVADEHDSPPMPRASAGEPRVLTIGLLALTHVACAWVVTAAFWRPARRCDYPVAVLLTAFATFYMVPVFAGWVTGRMNLWVVGTGLGVAAGAALAAALAGRAGTAHWRDRAARAGKAAAAAARSPAIGGTLMWLPIVVIVAATLWAGLRLPIRNHDAVCYHALNPLRWAETGRFVIDAAGDPVANPYWATAISFPNAKGILVFLVLKLTNREAGTALAQWPFLLLLVAAGMALFRRIGLPHWAAAAGVLFMLLAPEVLLQSLDAYADLAFLAAQIAVIWACVAVWQEGPRWRMLMLGGLAFAVLAGTKPTALTVGAALGAAYLAIVWLRSAGTARRRRTAAALCIALAAGFVVSGPWYVSAIRHFGSPLYPFEVRVGGRVLLPGAYPLNINQEFSATYVGSRGVQAWWDMMTEKSRTPRLAGYGGGLGAHTLILGVPAALLALAALASRRHRAVLLLPAVLFGLILAATPCWMVARFVLFELAAYGLAFGWLLAVTTPAMRTLLLSAFFGLAGYNVFRTVPCVLGEPAPAEQVAYALFSGHARGAQVRAFPDEVSAVDYWREHLSVGGGILAVPRDYPPFNARPLFPGAGVLRGPEFDPATGPKAWAAALRQLGAGHVFVEHASPGYRAALADGANFRVVFGRSDRSAENPLMNPPGHGAIFSVLAGDAQ
jgi:hypothetical protein